uniref:Glycosyl transferase CAP10 domain-containing protein n=1 Tax=Paramoeba aestuarina TaxID=180227 RepID=A0A7S4UG82_9EUKA|mmetsp:Transcript_39965/g.63174  ORF Transcript_39965/g.63174 Transcript_39965/m.63174 type:complete len:280 (+) Transcript_39965:813-1652(+)
MTSTNPLSLPVFPKVDPHWFSHCKYNLHLPGHTRGGYSRALQNLLPQLTTVLFWESPYKEYYYDWLSEGTHYVSVKPENLVQTVDFFLENDDKALQIAQNGSDFYEHFLNWEAIITYWEWLLLTYMRLSVAAPPDLSEHCSCTPSEPVKICDFCKKNRKVRTYRDHNRNNYRIDLANDVIDNIGFDNNNDNNNYDSNDPNVNIYLIKSIDPRVDAVIDMLMKNYTPSTSATITNTITTTTTTLTNTLANTTNSITRTITNNNMTNNFFSFFDNFWKMLF